MVNAHARMPAGGDRPEGQTDLRECWVGGPEEMGMDSSASDRFLSWRRAHAGRHGIWKYAIVSDGRKEPR